MGLSLEMVCQVAWEQIKSFRELAEHFNARFITNSRVVKGLEALTHLRMGKKETSKEYSSRYWEVFQEAEDCDLKFAISTLKYGLPWDRDGIYNDLTRRPQDFWWFVNKDW